MRAAVVLSVYWFLSLGALGLFFPLYSLYLKENGGLSGSEVGVVMAIIPLVGMFAQPLWGNLADRSGSRSRILALVSLGAALGYLHLYFEAGFAMLALGTALLAVFSTALIPMSVATTLGFVQRISPHAFGLVRVWGTLGFLVAVVGFPRLISALEGGRAAGEAGSLRPGLELMLPFAAVLLGASAAVSLLLPRDGTTGGRAAKGDWRLLLRHGPFVRLLVFMFGAYVFMQGPMALFPIYVRSLGGDVEMVSRMWVFMLLLEIPLVALSGTGLARLGARGLIVLGISAGALRWTVCGFSSDLGLVYAVQILHGVTVMGLILGAPLYVEAVVPERLRATGQGMLAMVGVSLGGIVSNLGSGWLMQEVGAAAPAMVGGIGSLALALVLPWVLPRAEGAGVVEPHEELSLSPS